MYQSALGTKTEIIEALSRTLSIRPDLRLAILYGSAARDAIRNSSDIDLALALDSPMSSDEFLSLMDLAAEACGRPVDLADLRSAKGFFLHQILSRGYLFMNRDPALYESLAARSLEYIEDIHPIVQRERLRRIEEFARGK